MTTTVQPPSLSAQPRILIVDDDRRYREALAQLLSLWGYMPVVAEGAGPALLADARRKARSLRCHLALVDMFLIDPFDRDDLSGRKLIGELKPTESITISGYSSPQLAAKALSVYEAREFFHTSADPNDLYADVQRVLRRYCALPLQTTIHWPDGLSSAVVCRLFFGDAQVPHSQADELLARLFPSAQHLYLEVISGPHHTPSMALRQRSVVLRVRADDRQPVVIKIARTPRLQTEIERYAAHIQHRLHSTLYAQLSATCLLWDLGAAHYTYLGADPTSMRSFSAYYAAEPASRICYTLRHLFAQIWGNHYRMRASAPGSLFAQYSAVWDADWIQRLHAFPTPTARIPLPHRPQETVPHPVVWLRNAVGLAGAGPDRSDLPDLLQAITHGDMQGDNIFVDQRAEPWMIDFERTGPGPILQDFVELEADILTRLADFGPNDAAAFVGTVRRLVRTPTLLSAPQLNSGKAIARKAVAVVGELRCLAAELSGSTAIEPYLWGLLFNAVFRATLLPATPANLTRRTWALTLGGLICERLDALGQGLERKAED